MLQNVSEVIQRVFALQTEILMPQNVSEVLQKVIVALQTEILMPLKCV